MSELVFSDDPKTAIRNLHEARMAWIDAKYQWEEAFYTALGDLPEKDSWDQRSTLARMAAFLLVRRLWETEDTAQAHAMWVSKLLGIPAIEVKGMTLR